MAHIALTKTPIGFIPADPQSTEFYQKVKTGSVIHAEFKQMRNSKFHRKFFALLNLAYEYWVPGQINSKYGMPEKNFDRFRKDLIILAGRYHTVIRLDGSVRIEADSISFANMPEDEFERLYNDVLTVIMNKILPDMDKAEIESLAEQFLRFA